MAIYRDYFEQRSAEWYRIRLGIPTASEMDKIITPTGKPSKQADAYMNRLLAEWVLGEPLVNEYESSYMQLGRDNEPAAVKAFEFQTGLKTKAVGFVTTDDGMAGASPDRLVEDTGTLELKCPAPNTQIGYLLSTSKVWTGAGVTVAEDYKVQNQAQMWICEREKSWVSSYHPRLPPVILDIPRDDAFIKLLSGAVRAFVDTMLERRADLESRFGPFERPEPTPTRKRDYGPFGVSQKDLDDLFATRQ